MRYLLLILLLFVSVVSFGQDQAVRGRIVDIRGKGIEFAVIKSKEAEERVIFTDSLGFYQLDYKDQESATIIYMASDGDFSSKRDKIGRAHV